MLDARTPQSAYSMFRMTINKLVCITFLAFVYFVIVHTKRSSLNAKAEVSASRDLFCRLDDITLHIR